jgi:hypothetical protein
MTKFARRVNRQEKRKAGSSGGSFAEPTQGENEEFLTEVVAKGITRSDVIDTIETLLGFTENAAYTWTDTYGALIYSTISRSARTYRGVCLLLRAALPVQAAMLTRTLFEDVIISHWLLFNHKDPDWLVERFLRHREAIALHQRKLQKETGWSIGPQIPAPDDLESRAEDLRKEFGKEAQWDWWDPGRQGEGKGQRVGLRKIVNRLEAVAAERKMFHPRFAGGEEPLIRKMDLVINKWLSQCIHHTTIGLPFTPTDSKNVAYSGAAPEVVAFSASWLFAQQIYLLFDIEGRGYKPIDIAWFHCMALFVEINSGPEEAERLLVSLEETHGPLEEAD